MAGNSVFKGTATLINVWRKHPEWPKLTVVCNQLPDHTELPENIKVLSNISTNELAGLWATAGFAIQPSEVEGFGQILLEAQVYGCVVITTDAPPMHEVVDSSFGVLVPYYSTGAFRMGTRYFVDPSELEQSIHRLLAMPKQTLDKMSASALHNVKNNHKLFIEHFSALIAEQE